MTTSPTNHDPIPKPSDPNKREDAPEDPGSESDTDALLESLENETEEDAAYRTSRISQLNADFASAKASAPPSSTTGTGTITTTETYPTLTTDQSVLTFTTQSTRCVVHFAHPDFVRCKVMDAHLERLAGRHYDVRFARVDVRETPFIVQKLGIKVLPCVLGFSGGVGVERVVGFEGLGSGGGDGGDSFSETVLEKRLVWKGVLSKERVGGGGGGGRGGDRGSDGSGSESESDSEREDHGKRRAIRRGNMRINMDQDEDDDWD